jgi:hypothetical protein
LNAGFEKMNQQHTCLGNVLDIVNVLRRAAEVLPELIEAYTALTKAAGSRYDPG